MEDLQKLKIPARIIQWLSCSIPNDEFSGEFIKKALIFLCGEKCQGTKEDGSPCEWARVHPTTGKIPLEVDHIDGNSVDSRPENVRLLCPSCHALTPTYRILNRGQGRSVKGEERKHINFVITEIARRTGRISSIESSKFVFIHEAVPSPEKQSISALRAVRKQRFKIVNSI